MTMVQTHGNEIAPHSRPQFIISFLVYLSLTIGTSVCFADGGTVRLSEIHGAWRITVFTSPTPLTAGPVDVSVLIQDAETNRVAGDLDVTVRLKRVGRSGTGVVYPATREAATNKLFYSAILDVPVEGEWRFEVAIAGLPGPTSAVREPLLVSFEATASAPLPRWTQMWFWIFLPAPIVVLYAVNEILKERRRSRKPSG